MISNLFNFELLLAAFVGGAFGASIGALQSFTVTGLIVILGELYNILQENIGVEIISLDVTGTIGFGVVFGPHVAFGGGAAATAYAAKKGYLDDGFRYHSAKNITKSLGSRIDVLTVGGIFGVFGYLITSFSEFLSFPTDPVALGVVCSAVLHRLIFRYSLIGISLSNIIKKFDSRFSFDSFVFEPWLPYQRSWRDVLFLGFIVGVISGYLAYYTGSAFLAFGLSAFLLIFMIAGIDRVPVTHHMSLPASTAVLASIDTSNLYIFQSVSDTVTISYALILGGVFGLIGGFFGEVSQRIFYEHAETHLDPPAVSIVITSFIIAFLFLLGVFPSSSWIPYFG